MKDWITRVTAIRNVIAALMGVWAITFYKRALASEKVMLWGFFAIFVITGVALSLRQKWARWLAICIVSLMALSKAAAMFTQGFSLRQSLAGIGIGVLAYLLWKEPDNSLFGGSVREREDAKKDEDNPGAPMISLVHLRRQQRYLEASVLANALSDAWGLEIFGGDGEPSEDGDGFVAGNSPFFMVIVRKPSFCMFSVHNHDRNYFDDPDKVAKGVANRRFAEVIREHSSWLSVDLMRMDESSVGQDEAYRMIGKAVSALADDDVMVILCPQHHYFNLWSPELEKLLCSDSPLKALREEVKAPVYGVQDGDAIEKAIATARERWPEFVAAFKTREPGDERYLVKARFVGEDDEVEHMWLQVMGLEPEYVHGHLLNEPMHTRKLKKGSQVEVSITELSDWVCPDAEGNMLGNFTARIIEAAAASAGTGA